MGLREKKKKGPKMDVQESQMTGDYDDESDSDSVEVIRMMSEQC